MWCPEEPLPRKARSLAWLGGFFLLCRAAAQTPEPLPDLDDFKIPLWYPSFEVRGGLGYKDNVLLSSTNAQDSAFWGTGIEALVFRLPTAGWQFNALLDATDVRYFDAPSVDNEQMVLATAELSRDLGRGWKSTLGFNYVFLNQVFDLSSTYPGQTSVGLLRGHTLSPRWKARWSPTPFWVEAELSGARQIMKSQYDNYWLIEPRVAAGHTWKNGSEASLTYRWSHFDYDTREQVDLSGTVLTNTSLAFQVHAVELGWTQVFDAKRRWQATSRAGFEANLDNGPGYFDYLLYRFRQELRFRAETVQIKARALVGHYDYTHQTVSATDPSRRRKTQVALGLSAEYTLAKHLKTYANYTWERSISNLAFDDYQANVVSGGFVVTY